MKKHVKRRIHILVVYFFVTNNIQYCLADDEKLEKSICVDPAAKKLCDDIKNYKKTHQPAASSDNNPPANKPTQNSPAAPAIPAVAEAMPAPAAPVQAAAVWPLSAVRIRGSADDLWITNSDSSQQNGEIYGGAKIATTNNNTANNASIPKATFNFSNDNVKNSSTETLTGVFGFQVYSLNAVGSAESSEDSRSKATKWLNDKLGLNEIESTFYVGVNRNVTTPAATTKAKTASSITDTVDLGLSFSSFYNKFVGNTGEIAVNLRPHYLMDLQNGSESWNGNLRLIPFFPDADLFAHLNNFYKPDSINNVKTKTSFDWKVILDARVDGGTFINRGNSFVSPLNKDFVRVGGQAGLGLSFDFFDQFLPTWVTTYTGMYGAVSNVNVEYLSSAINLNLTAIKGAAVSVSYTNGYSEDTPYINQNIWKIGLSGAY